MTRLTFPTEYITKEVHSFFVKHLYVIISILFYLAAIITPTFIFAQPQKKIVVIMSLAEKNIELNSLSQRHLKYNNVSTDSFANSVAAIINKQVVSLFKNDSVCFLNQFYNSTVMHDSIYKLKQWNCFYADSTSITNIKNNGTSLNSYHNIYTGFDFNPDGYTLLQQVATSSNCDYIVLISKFEIINPNSIFSLHVEVLNKQLQKIYGDKNELKRSISKTMYFDVLKHYVNLSVKDMLVQVNDYLNTQH